jgi:hypothetical protein
MVTIPIWAAIAILALVAAAEVRGGGSPYRGYDLKWPCDD